jgi:hypothetical protein
MPYEPVIAYADQVDLRVQENFLNDLFHNISPSLTNNQLYSAPAPTTTAGPVTTTQTQTEEKVMSAPATTTTTTRLKSVGGSVASQVKKGMAQGAIGTANRQVVALLEAKLGDNFPTALRNEAGRKALEMMIPTLILLAVEFDTKNQIPGKSHLESAANYALTDAAAQGTAHLLDIVINELGPVLQVYRESGEILLGETEQVVFEEVAVKQKVGELVNR